MCTKSYLVTVRLDFLELIHCSGKSHRGKYCVFHRTSKLSKSGRIGPQDADVLPKRRSEAISSVPFVTIPQKQNPAAVLCCYAPTLTTIYNSCGTASFPRWSFAEALTTMTTMTLYVWMDWECCYIQTL